MNGLRGRRKSTIGGSWWHPQKGKKCKEWRTIYDGRKDIFQELISIDGYSKCWCKLDLTITISFS